MTQPTENAIHPPLRWGVLSTAHIGTGTVIPAIQAEPAGDVVAIASRNETTAQRLAGELAIPTAHGSYEALLADPAVEAVYNPLPNDLHVDWSIRALEAGKHVLCEKPLGVDALDAQRLVDAATSYPHLVVMEAFMYRFHPQWQAVKALIEAHAIGDVRYITQGFSYFNDDPDNIRNIPEHGGGALLDIGCYPVSQARHALASEPRRVLATMDIDPRFGTDRLTSAIMDFGETTASFTVSTQALDHQRCRIVGTTGALEIAIPVNAPADASTIITQSGENELVHEFGPTNQYGAQAAAFAAAVRSGGSAPIGLQDAIANLRVLDAVRQSHERGGWVDVD